MFSLYQTWQSLPIYVRHTVATLFGVAKIHPTHVSDNRIVADGYDFGDVDRAITPVTMEKLTGMVSEDMGAQWDALMIKLGYKTEERVSDESLILYPVLPVNFTKEEAEALTAIVDNGTTHVIVTAPYCGFCTSKGVRHLKVCTRPNANA